MRLGLTPLNYLDSWQFAKQAFHFLSANRDLNIFPLLALAATLIFLAGISALLTNGDINMLWALIIMLIYYFFLSFMTVYFNTIIAAVTMKRLNKEPADLRYGYDIANRAMNHILLWTLLASTIGLVARSLENVQNLIEKIVGFSFGFTWSLATYFVIPIFVIEQLAPIKATQRSIEIVGKGWRNTVSVKALFSIFFIILLLIVMEFLADSPYQLSNIVTIIIPLCLMMFALASTLENIITCALYLNAQQKTVEGFDKALLDRAFIKEY